MRRRIKVKVRTAEDIPSTRLITEADVFKNKLRRGELPPFDLKNSPTNKQFCPNCGVLVTSLHTKTINHFFKPDEHFNEYYCINCHNKWEQRQ